MKKLLKLFAIFLTNLIVNLLVFSSVSYAKEAVQILTSADCGYCQELEANINSESIAELLDVSYLDINDENNNEAINNIVNTCSIDLVTPVVFYNDTCFVGYTNGLAGLREIAGITTEDLDSEEKDEGTDNPDGYSTTSPDFTDATTVEMEIEESFENTRPEVKLTDMIFIILAPISFILVVYYIMTRLKP